MNRSPTRATRAIALAAIFAFSWGDARGDDEDFTRQPAYLNVSPPPAFPLDALAGRQSGFVEVSFVVHGSGILKDVRMVPDRPESSAFVPAIEAVIPAWRALPALRDCFPVPEEMSVRVTFRPDAARPVTIRETDGKARGKRTLPEHLKPVLQMKPAYPPFTYSDTQVLVYTKQEIDEWGKVVKVWATAYRTTPDSADRENLRKLVAQEELDDTLRKYMHNASLVAYRWVFPNAPADGHRFTCNSFLFSARPR